MLPLFPKNLTGIRFDRLFVIRQLPSKNKSSQWLCECDCGRHTNSARTSLVRGRARSCGCLRNEMTGDRFRSHGKTHTREYRIWFHMRERCRPSGTYWGKGIRVCRRWQSFVNFLKDMGPCPFSNSTIEREDNNGNYSPENCRWATMAEQSRNTSRSRFIEHNGFRMNVSEWALTLGVSKAALYKRRENGFSDDDIVTMPFKGEPDFWATNYRFCIDCGTNAIPHQGKGRCHNCYMKHRRKT